MPSTQCTRQWWSLLHRSTSLDRIVKLISGRFCQRMICMQIGDSMHSYTFRHYSTLPGREKHEVR